MSDLVFVQFSILQLSLSLVLEGDNDESHENVDEEEGKDDEVDDVEDGHLHGDLVLGTVVLLGGSHGVLKHSGGGGRT